MSIANLSIGINAFPALDLGVAEASLLELPPFATAVTDPDPLAAVPVEVPPAFWDPGPVNPAPFPAYLSSIFKIRFIYDFHNSNNAFYLPTV